MTRIPINRSALWLTIGLLLTLFVYWPGLHGSWLFDDYPNIVDNKGVQPSDAHISSLVRAALSSPSSEFKRPLASLSFAANYLASGLDPYWMKLTNLLIHLANGLLVFLLSRRLLRWAASPQPRQATNNARQSDITAVLITAGWLLLPINLTGVLYVVQRMESLANLFVLIGLLGYVAGRQKMLNDSNPANHGKPASYSRGLVLCLASITLPTAIGLLAKETAVMLPLYAVTVEWLVFRFALTGRASADGAQAPARDQRIVAMFALLLLLPLLIGLAWLLPKVASPGYWSTRDFGLRTRLLSEARIVVDYIQWTLLPTPDALSFYHDDFRISEGLFAPWTTAASILVLIALVAGAFWVRRRQPLVALGIAWFLGCHLLTGTILPLELIYEHRNYFASFGLLVAMVPMLTPGRDRLLALPRYVLLGGVMLYWAGLTSITANAWGQPLHLAEELAARAPESPRAQYELGRTYIIYSHYDPASPFIKMAYKPLEKAASLPNASILPEQALIFMNSRMHLPIKDAWWDSLIAKLRSRKSGVQDESSLGALTQCVRERRCDLSRQRMVDAYLAALSHPNPSARLLAMYGDYAWNVLGDHELGELMTANAVEHAPNEPAYRITLVRMLASEGRIDEARAAIKDLESLNIGGSLDHRIQSLRHLLNPA